MQQQMLGQDPTAAFRESCASQMVVSGAVSGLAGIVLGAVLAPFNSSMQAQIEHLPLRQQFVRGGQEIAAQSKSWGKNLAVIGAVFSTTECFVEKRARPHRQVEPDRRRLLDRRDPRVRLGAAGDVPRLRRLRRLLGGDRRDGLRAARRPLKLCGN